MLFTLFTFNELQEDCGQRSDLGNSAYHFDKFFKNGIISVLKDCIVESREAGENYISLNY